jgi:glycine/D-amino acid oxidase-like deaminating enzyme
MVNDHVVILGGGVIGFTSGIALLEKQASEAAGSSTELQVTVVSRDLPPALQPAAASSSTGNSCPPAASAEETDYPAGYASIWAGAHHVSDAKTPTQRRWDRHTFERMVELEREKPWRSYYPEESSAQPIVWVNQVETWQCWEGEGKPWDGVIDWYPDVRCGVISPKQTCADPSSSMQFRELAPEELPPGCALGCEFSTLDINVPLYLPWLRARFESLGGQVVRATVGSIADAVELAAKKQSGNAPNRVIVAPGLGAAQLQEVKDPHMQSVRGQVLRISAPHCVARDIKQCWQTSRNSKHRYTGFSRVCDKGFRDCYILPMGDGTFVVGGTRLFDDW